MIASSIIACVPWVKSMFEPSIRKKIRDLEDENARLLPLKGNVEKMFEVWLEQVLDILNLDDSWRASFYMYDEKNAGKSTFRFVARASDDPLRAQQGREEFPAEEGVIGQAWKRCGLASYYATASALKTKDKYIAEIVKKCGIPIDTAKALSMISARILSHVVCDKDGKKKGVLVIESTKPGKKTGRQAFEMEFTSLVKSISEYLAKLSALNADYVLCQEEPTEVK